MSAEQDSVRRLAEADAHALRDRAEAWAEEHYLHDSVGAFEAGWEARQPAIDSLTTERDRLAAAGCPRCGHALRNEQDHALGSPCPMCGCMSTGGSDGAEAWRIRAEAAEADRERLWEALDGIKRTSYGTFTGMPESILIGHITSVHTQAEAALATPPSEGGKS